MKFGIYYSYWEQEWSADCLKYVEKVAKLGFDVTPTGTVDSDTRDALHKFAKTHGLPASAEITPKLIKTLNAAVAAN